MSVRPLPAYQDLWGLTDETHEAVLNELEENYGGPSLVELDRKYRDLPVELYEGPEIEQGTYRHALREVDQRTWHDRCVDALVQFHQATFEDSEFDLMLREQDYNFTSSNTDYTASEMDRDMATSEEVVVPKSDIDFARISFREDELFMELWEVKAREEALQSSEQLQSHRESLDLLQQRTGLDVEVRARGLTSEGVKDKMHGTDDEYGIPRKYWGNIAVSPGSQEVVESERFEELQDEFFGGELDVEQALEEVQSQEEFLN